ncbi:hypothetical protein GCM10028822_32280 [Hymenobacter terrigena]
MKILSIRIENFRAINLLEMNNLSNAIVISGPNGCGKSSIFDAIRLLKSAYGQYNQGEYFLWFTEFGIDINKMQQDVQKVFYDVTKNIVIKAEFELNTEEKKYIENNSKNVYDKLYLQAKSNNMPGPPVAQHLVPAAQARILKDMMEDSLGITKEVEQELKQSSHIAEIRLNVNGEVTVTPSPVMQFVFSMYEPEIMGIIDYHSANRVYAREQVDTLQLQGNVNVANKSQHALYNIQNKYNGVKAEMARSYISQLIAKNAYENEGQVFENGNSLEQSLVELFAIFFPGKKFLGIRSSLNGGLTFPIQLENGREHDINDLSSGEKEILLGYLRIRNGAPRNSIILLDEPEMHLNPRVVNGLPRFYQKHLGAALNNQILLITHSDALLRGAVEEPGYNVYHMHPAYNKSGQEYNQLERVNALGDIERAILDLVGDLASYSPRSKVIILEGEESEIDTNIIRNLFPEFVERVNLISAGNKRRVGTMHELLDKASGEGKLRARFYSIVDRDFDGPEVPDPERRFKWDVYHIENYLLNPFFIKRAMQKLQLGGSDLSEDEIFASLKGCAAQTIKSLLHIKMEKYVNSKLVQCVSTKFDPKNSLSEGFRNAAERSMGSIGKVLDSVLQIESLVELEARLENELNNALNEDRWINEFRGRDILKCFAGKYHKELNVGYETLRNLIINLMRDSEFRPEGMTRVIDAIGT